MVVMSNGAHLSGAPTLFPSLQLGAASIGSLDPAIGVIDGCESSYAPAKAPLSFSEGSGGGGSNTIPGTPIHSINDEARSSLEDALEDLGLYDDDRLYSNFFSFFSDYVLASDTFRWKKYSDAQKNINERLRAYHRTFETLDALLDDKDSNVVCHAIRHMSQTLMTSELAGAIYPGSQMTYRGRVFKRSTEAWNRGRPTPSEEPTPMMELIRSLGTDRNAIPQSPIQELNQIVNSDDDDYFDSLIKGITDESMSFDEARSTSAAFAFVLSARLLKSIDRLESLVFGFIHYTVWNTSLFRDNASYWIPMGAIADAGNLIDDPAMYTEFISDILLRHIDNDYVFSPPFKERSLKVNDKIINSLSSFAVPAIFHLAANLHDKSRIEELVRAVHKDFSYRASLKNIIKHIRKYEWKFTVAEQAIAAKAVEVLKL
jgi:hypothetical protein